MSSKPLILVTLEYPPHYGGVGRMYAQLVAEAKVPIVVWTSPETKLLSSRGWPRWRATLARTFGQCLREPHTVFIIGQILPLGIPVWLLSYVFPLRYGVFVHGMDLARPLKVSRRRWVITNIFRRAHAVFPANAHVAELVKKACPTANIKIIYPGPYLRPKEGVSRDQCRDLLSIAQTDIVLVTVARLVERKGHRIVLEALIRLQNSYPSLRYVIIGDGPERANLEQVAKRLPHPDRVTFLGSAPDDVIANWLTASDVFIMTPHALPNGDIEGLGIVYLEAGAFGLPVIASRSGGVPEAVIDQKTGVLVPENDVAATTEAIDTLLKNEALRKQFGQKARAFVEQTFDSQQQGAQMIAALYD